MSSAKDPEPVSTGRHQRPEIRDELAVTADIGQFMSFTNIYHQNLIVVRLLFYWHVFKYLCCFDLAPEKESKIAKAGKIPRLQKKMGTPSTYPSLLTNGSVLLKLSGCFLVNVTEIIM